jgi:hypothetical protein
MSLLDSVGDFFSGDSPFWTSSKDAFDYTDLIQPAFQAATSLGGQLFASGAQEDAAKSAQRQKALDNYYALQMELAKSKLGGGGRGGGGGARAGLSDAERIAAQAQARNMKIDALNSWIAQMQSVGRR